MNARFGKVLIFVLCGALLLIAGCTTAPPAGGGGPTPAATTSAPAASNPDIGTVISLMRTMNDQISVIADNTRPAAGTTAIGNIVLFDNAGNNANAITEGTSVVVLPQKTCDVAIYGDGVLMFTTVEEMKDYTVGQNAKNTRNSQSCFDVYLCRRMVTLDSDYPYLYVDYKPYRPTDSLDRVTLAYRC
jgi:hypothetical protein